MPVGAPYLDFPTLVFVIVVILVIDLFAYMTKIGIFYIAATMIGVYVLGALFNQGFLVQQTTYDPNLGTYASNNTDPNLPAILLAVLTIISAYFVYWERNFNG